MNVPPPKGENKKTLEKALELSGRKRHAEALHLYDRLISEYESKSAPTPQERDFIIAAYFNKAVTLDRLNRLSEAEANYSRLFQRFRAFFDPAMAAIVAINFDNISYRLRGHFAYAFSQVESVAPKNLRETAKFNESIATARHPEFEPFLKKAGNAKFSPIRGWTVWIKGRPKPAGIPSDLFEAVGKRELKGYGIITPPLGVDVRPEMTPADDLKGKIALDGRGIPLVAPAKWPGKDKSGTTLEIFFRKWWASYLEKGLALSDIKRLDPTLHNSLKRHFRNRLVWPKDLEFPNERKDLQWAVAQFKIGNVELLTPKQVIAVGRWLKRQETAPKTQPPKSTPVKPSPRHLPRKAISTRKLG
jgi:hypothetical protein